MKVKRIDHIVLTVQDVDRAAQWYARVFGMEVVIRADGHKALEFGDDSLRQRIHLHAAGRPLEPHAAHPTRGAADLCLLANKPLPELLEELARDRVEMALPSAVRREGAMGPTESVYIYDLDGNLIEIADYPHDLRNEEFERYQ